MDATLAQASNAKRKAKAKEATTIGVGTGVTRTLIMQMLHLYYRTPVKLFRPLRVDYLVMAKALMPAPDVTSKKSFSFRYTSLGIISNAIKAQGWSFIHRHLLPPFLANALIGTVLYTTYVATLSALHPPFSIHKHHTFPPPPFWTVFCAGSLAGAAQSVIATPLDSLKVRFEVNDLLDGKHKSMFEYASKTFRELGWKSAYRGFGLTLFKDSMTCGLFFGVFEWVKQQGYYYYLDEFYGYHLHQGSLSKEQMEHSFGKPSWILEPAFVMAAGGAASVAYQMVEHPIQKIDNLFWVEEAEAEFINPGKKVSTSVLYRSAWKAAQAQARVTGGWRKFLYKGFGGTIVRAVPATSVGLLAFEMLKWKMDVKFDETDIDF